MTVEAKATMYKMQIFKNSNLYEECGALMTCETGEWTPAQFATEAEGFAAVAKAFSITDNAMGDFARAVEVGSADDLAAVVMDMVKRSKYLNKNANLYARNGNTQEAARLRAIRDGYMTRAHAAKATMAAIAEAIDVARTERAERLTKQPAPIDWAFVDSIDPEHLDRLALAQRVRSLLDMRADFKARSKLVLLDKTNALIDCLCAADDAGTLP